MAGKSKDEWFKFTAENIKMLEGMSGAGLTNGQMAAVLGTSEKTFRRAVAKNAEARKAIDAGNAKAIYNVASMLYTMAASGKNPAATFFYLKTRAGWREVNRTEHTGEDGKPIETKNDIKLTIKDYRA